MLIKRHDILINKSNKWKLCILFRFLSFILIFFSITFKTMFKNSTFQRGFSVVISFSGFLSFKGGETVKKVLVEVLRSVLKSLQQKKKCLISTIYDHRKKNYDHIFL